MPAPSALVSTAAALARARPDLWVDLIKALEMHSVQRARECVRAAPVEVHTAQGRAQEANYLLEQLSDAVKSADRIVQRRQTTEK